MTLEDLYRLLRAGHVQAQGIVDSVRVPLVVLDEALCVVNTNPAFLETFRVSRDETMGACFLRLGNGQWNSPELERLLRNVIPRSAAVLGYEIVHVFPHIGRRTMLVNARRLAHPDNTSNLLLVMFEDVTDRRAEAAREDLISSEIRHRFKNFLALVSSLARQSPADGVTAEEYRDSLLGRIDALAEAELLVFGEDTATLRTVLERVTMPYGRRVAIGACPDVEINAREAASLSMILHELATNAAKHGSLSCEGGHVAVEAELGEGAHPRLRLAWTEQGGPVADTEPHKGFGRRLIQMIAEQQLGGQADLDFAPQGLRAVVSFAPASARPEAAAP